MTLTNRLSIYLLSLVTLILVGFSLALYRLAELYLDHEATQRLDAVVSALGAAAEIGPEGVEWEPASRRIDLDAPLFSDRVVWLVKDDRGRVLTRAKSTAMDGFLTDIAPNVDRLRPQNDQPISAVWKTTHWIVRQSWIRADPSKEESEPSASTSGRDVGKLAAISITVGYSLTSIRTSLDSLAISLIAISSAIWLATLFTSRFVCRRALRPVGRMAAAAARVDASDLANQRLPPLSSRDELGDLTARFNGLLDRLQESFERQRRFTGDASHQLRTPLTAILGQIEVALRRDRPTVDYRNVLLTIHDKTLNLCRIVESMLFLARADTESGPLQLESIDLRNWTREHAETWSSHPRARDISVDIKTESCLVAQTRPALLTELLNILIDNACKFSEPGAPIVIRVARESNTIKISVIDRGFGMDREDLQRLFTPFHRAADARRRGIEGVGLGLSIAKRLAATVGGSLTADSQVNVGTTLSLRLSASDAVLSSTTKIDHLTSSFNPNQRA